MITPTILPIVPWALTFLSNTAEANLDDVIRIVTIAGAVLGLTAWFRRRFAREIRGIVHDSVQVAMNAAKAQHDEQNVRFDRIDDRMDGLTQRVDRMGERLDDLTNPRRNP
jgi:hypothetical protein